MLGQADFAHTLLVHNYIDCEELLFCGVKVFLCIVCQKTRVCSFVKCSCSSHGAGPWSTQQDIHEVCSIICVCGQFGFTMPFQDYGSGSGTPLAHKLEGWVG